MDDEFTTVLRESHAETRIHGSRFIAVAGPAGTPGDFETLLSRLKKEYYDATHHCYAYRIGIDGGQFRYNDDGEPGGSAGKPILGAIDKFHLTDLAVIVIRYFGGTKLGVGGLVRAYAGAAEAALIAAPRVTRYAMGMLEVTFPHAHVSNVMHVVNVAGARIVDTTYDEEVHLRLAIRRSKLEELRSSLVDRTRGNITLRP